MALLTTAMVPAFVLATNAVSLSTTIRNSLIAANLAQEGAEITRAIRDANWFNPGATSYADGLDSCNLGCTVQYDSTSPVVAAFVATPLKLDPVTGLYQYNSGEDTIFTRTITTETVSDHELKVVSLVEWKERGVQKSSMVEYHLYDWLQ